MRVGGLFLFRVKRQAVALHPEIMCPCGRADWALMARWVDDSHGIRVFQAADSELFKAFFGLSSGFYNASSI